MSEVAVQVAVASPVAGKKVKKAASATKKPKTQANHPPTSEMVDAAIGALKERGGSSLLAIKKYIAATYKVDVEKTATFIKKYLKSAVVKGHLLQTKGKGASGSFKLSTKAPAKKAAAKPKSDKPKKAVKKPAGDKKKVAAKKSPAKKPAAAKKAKVTAAKKSVTAKAKPAKAAGKPKAAAKPKKAAAPKKAATPKVKKPAAKKVSAKK